MRQTITVKQKLEALDEQIIPLITEGMFLEGEIHIDDYEFYLTVHYAGSGDPLHEYDVGLAGQSEFFEEACHIDSCDGDELIEYITEFHSNPHQFAETYGY